MTRQKSRKTLFQEEQALADRAEEYRENLNSMAADALKSMEDTHKRVAHIVLETLGDSNEKRIKDLEYQLQSEVGRSFRYATKLRELIEKMGQWAPGCDDTIRNQICAELKILKGWKIP